MAGTPDGAQAALVSFDAYKAFDTINWDYLFAVMRKMGIGGQFIKWVQLLYKNPKARLILNESWSEIIHIRSGTRQGCPLSSMLFAIGMEPMLRLLNTTLGDAGVTVNGVPNLTVAYADDLLVCLANPARDLSRVTQLMEKHGTHAGFKINWKKSIYFPYGGNAPQVAPDPRLITKTDCFKYLGIKIAKTEHDLFTFNYGEGMHNIQSKLNAWTTLPLNIAARISAVKMSTLPKLLYLFHNVPVNVPTKFFSDLRSITTKFIWKNKVPRVAYEKLTRPYEEGGFELPNFQLYYKAAQLQHVVKWLEPETTEPQVLIEQKWFGAHKASRLMMDSRVKGVGREGPALKGLRLWRSVNSKIADGAGYSKYISIWDVSIHNPSLSEKMYVSWMEHGILMLQDLYSDKKLKDDKDLVDEAGGGAASVMKWLTLKHCLQKRWGASLLEPKENALIAHALTTIGERHQISRLYKIMRLEKLHDEDALKQKWERMLEVQISEKVWKTTCEATRNVAFCMKLRLVHYRFLTQSYYTPSILNKIFKSQDVCCAKCKDPEADFLHMTWGCPLLSSFWREVFDVISRVSGVMVPCVPTCAYLYDVPKMDIVMLRWVKVAIVTAKLMIARKWMSSKSPTLAEWKAHLVYCATQESELKFLMPTSQTPKDIWKGFRSFLTGHTSLNGSESESP